MSDKGEKAARENYKVMVIDNADKALTPYAQSLAEHFDITYAANIKEAWEILNSSNVQDLILVDVMLHSDKVASEENGLVFCRRLADNYPTSDIPVVFLSSLETQDIKTLAFEAGGSDYIVIPSELTEIASRVRAHASRYRRTRDLETLIDIDPLTHLPNAAKFNETLHQEWLRCARYWHHISLLLIKLNNIEAYELKHGKDEYYALVASVADELSSIGARPGDMFASISEDCFGLLLSDCSTSGARMKAQQIMEILTKSDLQVGIQNQNDVDCKIAMAVAAPSSGGSSSDLYNSTKALLQSKSNNHESKFIELENIIGAA